MAIIVTGTPGTGKTTLAKKIAAKLKYKYIDVNKVIKKEKLCEEVDKERKCMVVDEKRLAKALIELIKKNKKLVIDSHMSYFIPKKYVDLCIITTCSLKKLKSRLVKRKYSKNKIADNLEAEIFSVCLVEAKEAGHNVFVVDTSDKINMTELFSFIQTQIR